MPDYPDLIDALVHKIANYDTARANDINELQDALTAFRDAVGNAPQGSALTLVARLAVALEDSGALKGHKTSHQSGGGDAIKLDDLAAPDDNTDLNASTSKHGLLPKLSGRSGDALRGDGTWDSVSAGAVLSDVKVFESSGTWTKPTGLYAVLVKVVGGGGAGGGAQATNSGETSSGSGGGGGGYSEKHILAASLGATETVTVGAGGTANSGAAGGDGGTTSFGAHLQATGGTGGLTLAKSSLAGFGAGVAGGIGSDGDVNAAGDASGFCSRGATSLGSSAGGGSALGGGGLGVITSAAGNNGGAYGGGGSGACNSASQNARSGGAGAAGVVIVYEFTAP